MKLRQARKLLRQYIISDDPFILFDTPRNFRARRRWRKWRLCRQRKCDHKHWRNVSQDGRHCSCGYLMFDPGD